MKVPYIMEPFDTRAPVEESIGEFEAAKGKLCISFNISGDLSPYDFSSDKSLKERHDLLWRKSCLEFFIRKWNEKEYIEVNLSTTGAWQAYHFDNYRSNPELFQGLELENFSFEASDKLLQCEAEFKICESKFWDHKDYNLGVSSVLLKENKNYDHLALMHLGDEPDFHRPESFGIKFNI